MQTHYIQNKNYYFALELTKFDPVFFKKSLKRVREIIINHAIPKSKYIYCNKQNGKTWIPVENKPTNNDKLFISKKWCDNNVPMLMNDLEKAISIQKFFPLPPLCNITDEELFCIDGYFYDVEVRGERTSKKCYFSAIDIAYILNVAYINTNIADSFDINTDYIKCVVPNLCNTQKKTTKYFFTYQGLIKFIFRSRSTYAQPFIVWATETLFALHIGTTEQKAELINNYLGADFKLFKQVMSCHPGKISCVYLVSLGVVKDLKDTFSIENERDINLVCKYGRTNDIDRRMTELSNEYKKKNKKIALNVITFSFIDDAFSSKAEKDMADIFSNDYHKLENISENELICVNKRQISNISRLYRTLENDYGREYDKIKASYVEKDLIKERIIMDKDRLLMDKDKMLLEKDKILLEKNVEIERLTSKNTELSLQSKIDKLTYQLSKVNVK